MKTLKHLFTAELTEAERERRDQAVIKANTEGWRKMQILLWEVRIHLWFIELQDPAKVAARIREYAGPKFRRLWITTNDLNEIFKAARDGK